MFIGVIRVGNVCWAECRNLHDAVISPITIARRIPAIIAADYVIECLNVVQIYLPISHRFLANVLKHLRYTTCGRYLRRTEPIREKHRKQPHSMYRIGFSNRCRSIIEYTAYRKHLCRYEIILK